MTVLNNKHLKFKLKLIPLIERERAYKPNNDYNKK